MAWPVSIIVVILFFSRIRCPVHSFTTSKRGTCGYVHMPIYGLARILNTVECNPYISTTTPHHAVLVLRVLRTKVFITMLEDYFWFGFFHRVDEILNNIHRIIDGNPLRRSRGVGLRFLFPLQRTGCRRYEVLHINNA